MGNMQNEHGNNKTFNQLLFINDDKENKANTYLNAKFLQSFNKQKNVDCQTSLNPLCPIRMKVSQNWMTCCFISPIMILVSPIYLLDKNGDYKTKGSVLIKIGAEEQNVEVVDVIIVKEGQICLGILERPVTQLGWMNISFYQGVKEVKKSDYKIVNYPERVLKNSKFQYKQKIRWIGLDKAIACQKGGYLVSNNDISGSIIMRKFDDTPMIIGLQINEQKLLIFDRKIFKKIKKNMKQYLLKNKEKVMNMMGEQILPQRNINDNNLMKKVKINE